MFKPYLDAGYRIVYITAGNGGGVILIVFCVIWVYMKLLMKMRSKHATLKPNPAHGEYLMNLCSDMQKTS